MRFLVFLLMSFMLTPAVFSVEEQAILEPDGASNNSTFGSCVYGSAESGVIVVGAPYDNAKTGAVFVFRYNGTDWVQEQKLVASDGLPNLKFGSTVSIYGGVVVVGSPRDSQATGAAYVFRYNGTSWDEEAKLVPKHADANDSNGGRVCVGTNRVLIGAVNGSYETETVTGYATLFRYDKRVAGWFEEAVLVASDRAQYDRFGICVGADSDRDLILVGACHKDEQGAAYVYRRRSGESSLTRTTIVEEAKLLPSDPSIGAEFGWSTCIDGDYALVCATQTPTTPSGAGYVFRYNGTDWVQEQKLAPKEAQPGDGIGYCAAAAGPVILLGAESDDDLAPNAGAVYYYEYFVEGLKQAWRLATKFTASDGQTGDKFGVSVCIDGELIVVGASSAGVSGKVYVFNR